MGDANVATADLVQSSVGQTVVGPLGDVDGDGYADFAIGKPETNAATGSVAFCLSQALPCRNDNAVQAGARLGSGVAGGDWNGDGFADAAVGAPAVRLGANRRRLGLRVSRWGT